MNIYKDNEIDFIYFTLFIASYNDWIRIPGTVASLYRVLLPIVLLLCILRFRKRQHYFIFGGILLILNVIQNIIFYNISGIELRLSFMVKYCLLFLSIICIFMLVKLLRIKNEIYFKQLFIYYIPKIGVINLIFYWLCATPLQEIMNLANRNNYAVSLAAIFPYFFLKGMKSKQYFIFCFFTVLSLVCVGSKSAVLGIGLEIVLILVMKAMRRIRNAKRAGVLSLLSVLFLGFLVMQTPVTIHGYSVGYMFSEMTSHIISGTPYPKASTSLWFRTNALIYMTDYLRESKFMGIGIGNTGRFLLKSMPEDHVQKYYDHHPGGEKLYTLSPHNALLEFFCDCGLWAIIMFYFVFKKAIIMFLNPKKNDFVDAFFVSFVVSFPIWCMSASGVYTTYYLFILIACFYEWYQIKREDESV